MPSLKLTLDNVETLPDGGPVSFDAVGHRDIDIGRASYLDWTLPDPSVSGHHCEIRFRDGGYWLTDHSTNGTYLNGSDKRISEPWRLNDGDRIEIGPYLVNVAVVEDAVAAPTSDAPAAAPSAGAFDGSLWDAGDAAPPAPTRGRGANPARPVQPDVLDWHVDLPQVEPSAPAPAPTPGPDVYAWPVGGEAERPAPEAAPSPVESDWSAPASAQVSAPEPAQDMMRDPSVTGGDEADAGAPTADVADAAPEPSPAEPPADPLTDPREGLPRPSVPEPSAYASPPAEDTFSQASHSAAEDRAVSSPMGEAADGPNAADDDRAAGIQDPEAFGRLGGPAAPSLARSPESGSAEDRAAPSAPEALPDELEAAPLAPDRAVPPTAPAPVGSIREAADEAMAAAQERLNAGTTVEGLTPMPRARATEKPARVPPVEQPPLAEPPHAEPPVAEPPLDEPRAAAPPSAPESGPFQPSPVAPPRSPDAGFGGSDVQRASAPTAATPSEAASDGDVRAFVEAIAAEIGIPPHLMAEQDPADLAKRIGAFMRLSAEGMHALLKARASSRGYMRAGSATMVQAIDNNPLKFMPTAEDAMRVLMGPPTRAYLDVDETMRESFGDIGAHQTALYAAMQAAVQRMFLDLAPKAIEEGGGDDSSLGRMMGSRKAKLWDTYKERYNARAEPHDNGMVDVFLMYFSEAYTRALGKS